MDKATARRALQYVKAYKRRWQEYQEDVDHWYRSGEGKTKGYRYPYCFHGSSLWTDYDNICGPCEDGFNGYNPTIFYRWAVDSAKYDMTVVKARSDWLLSVPEMYGRIPADLHRKILDWVMEPIASEV